jgi:hypothetical protein
MNFNPFPDLLLLIVIVIGFGFTIFSFIRATRITRNKAYLLLTLGFITIFTGYLLIFLTTLFTPADNMNTLVLTLIILDNIFMVLGFLIFTNSLILIRENRLPVFSHIAGILSGVALFIITTIKVTDINYNPEMKFWEANYNTDLLLPIGIPIAVIFVAYFILYLSRKFQNWLNYKKFDHTFLAFSIIVFWMIGTFIDQLRLIKHFLFPVAIFFFGTAVFFDPLNMLVSNKLPDEIILVTQNNQPIIRYNVIEKKVEKNLDEVKLLIAGKKIIKESLNSSKTSKAHILEGKEIKIVSFKHFHIIATGTRIDQNSTAAIHLAFCKFRKLTNIEYLHTSVIMNEPDEQLFVEIFEDSLRRIDAVKQKKKKKKK